MSRPAPAALLLLVALTAPLAATAFGTQDAPLPAPGKTRITVSAGPITVARDPRVGHETSLELGLTPYLELAAPLALGVRLLPIGESSAITGALGVVDFHTTADAKLLLAAAATIAAHARLGAEACLLMAADLTWVAQFPEGGELPMWARGAAALAIDMGPWLTVAGGISYQRLARGDGPHPGTAPTGWVGDERLSFGGVRARPFTDLPTLSVHALEWLDVIAIIRFDVDTDRRNAASRWLFGLQLNH